MGGHGILHERIERAHQGRPRRPQFPSVMEREIAQERFAVWREGDEDLSPVRRSSAARDQPLTHRAANQLDRAVVLQLQPLGEAADGRALPIGQALQARSN